MAIKEILHNRQKIVQTKIITIIIRTLKCLIYGILQKAKGNNFIFVVVYNSLVILIRF